MAILLLLGPKAMNLALESSFYLEINNEINHPIGMVRMIEPLSSNSRGCLKNSRDHCFCDNLEIVIPLVFIYVDY